MQQFFKRRLRAQRRWSGLLAIAFVIALRLLGFLQPFEWKLLDYLLRLRPAEKRDERITIVAIDEPDIQWLDNYPVPDRKLGEIIQVLKQYQPRVIGLDIFRDLPVNAGPGDQAFLKEIFQSTPNLVAAERVLGSKVPPPPGLLKEQVENNQVGFADTLPDKDGFLRRSLLGVHDQKTDKYLLSFVTQITKKYLAKEGLKLENGIRNPDSMRFGKTELPLFRRNDGGYIRADADGTQILVNFRRGENQFLVLSLQDVMTGNINPDQLRDRVVMLGVTANSVKDIVNSAAIRSVNPSLVSGVEFQAHATSQILSAVLEGRPFLTVWPNGIEYAWIVIWGVAGIAIGRLSRAPGRQLQLVFISVTGLTLLAYGLLMVGVWIPLLPTIMAFLLNSVVLYAFYVYDQSLRDRIQARQQLIQSSYTKIHNGPLQDLGILRRRVRGRELLHEQIVEQLDDLNRELRQVYDDLEAEADAVDGAIYLNDDQMVKLDTALHELLYEVYCKTIARDFPAFASIQLKIPEFEPMQDQALSARQKRDLCRFLEEALCNVGKYAKGATRLKIICRQEGDRNLIQVTDNGEGIALATHAGGRGTAQAKMLEKQLGATFRRVAVSPRGVCCELSWPVQHSWRSRLRRFLQT